MARGCGLSRDPNIYVFFFFCFFFFFFFVCVCVCVCVCVSFLSFTERIIADVIKIPEPIVNLKKKVRFQALLGDRDGVECCIFVFITNLSLINKNQTHQVCCFFLSLVPLFKLLFCPADRMTYHVNKAM